MYVCLYVCVRAAVEAAPDDAADAVVVVVTGAQVVWEVCFNVDLST
jgi:hypothetical protein